MYRPLFTVQGGVSIQVSGGLCPGGEVSVQGLSVWEGLCLEGLCPGGGLCQGEPLDKDPTPASGIERQARVKTSFAIGKNDSNQNRMLTA